MKQTLLMMFILCCTACSNGKNEYIQSVSHINSMLNEYWIEEGKISDDMANIAQNDFSEIKSYRASNQNKILTLEKKASVIISEIDKLQSAKYKSDNIDKLFQETRHNIMESLYNMKYEINSSLYVDRAYTVTTNNLKYIQQYNIEFRSLVN